MAVLRASTAAGESGPVISLSGEADVTTAEELAAVIDAQVTPSRRYLTIDVSELAFADSASVKVLILTARSLRMRGGDLLLLDPQVPLTRVLSILGADQMMTILHRHNR
jgi:anti-anti-sigma factor